MPEPRRQLAAIMFTDIVGYTAMMGQNERETLNILRKNKEIHRKWIRHYNGTLIKEIGDGILASFQSTSNAVYCGGAILNDVLRIEDLDLRIGIHLGEITIDDNEIYGDGINIASRIEGIAKTGEILVSESVYKTIKNKEEFNCTFCKEHILKNVEEPVRIYSIRVAYKREGQDTSPKKTIKAKSKIVYKKPMALIAISFVLIMLLVIYIIFWETPYSSEKGVKEPAILNSIAVLPFEDMSPSGDQEYLGDGISEEIINILTKIDDLKVIGRTSSFSFKNQHADLKTIGEKLGVTTILEGSVRKYDNQIRITAQLINAKDGSHLWSETYDRTLENIFIIQDEISHSIADKFKLTLTLSLENSPPTRNLKAYELFLRAKNSYGKGIIETEDAMHYLEETIKLDQSFSRAHILLSDVYFAMGLYGLAEPQSIYKKARRSAMRAIEINPQSYQGYYKLSWLDYFVDWNKKKALDNYRKARELGLTDAEDTHSYFLTEGKINLEIPIHRTKIKLEDDPLSGILIGDLSRMYLWADQYDSVLEVGNQLLEYQSENTSIKRHMGWAYYSINKIDMASQLFKELVEKDSTYVPEGYIASMMRSSYIDESWNFFNAVNQKLSSFKKASCYMHLNQLDSAFKYFEMAYKEKDVLMPFFQLEPQFDMIADDPRFIELLIKMNLPVD